MNATTKAIAMLIALPIIGVIALVLAILVYLVLGLVISEAWANNVAWMYFGAQAASMTYRVYGQLQKA